MLRPPRTKGRFQGEATTSLSNPYMEADGRRLRRRYAVYAAMAVILVVGIVAAVKSSGGGNGSSKSSPPPEAPKGAFVLESQSTISAIKGKTKVFRHKKSGMEILSVVPNDTTQDAVFGISFRTNMDDNSGVAYVVQKSIQDGSESFPIKDPFNQLKRGSLQTHMESWIDKDRSGYTYASRNKVDFRNGIKVYLDGIFKPNFMKDSYNWIFRQEAWRLVRIGNQMVLSGNAVNEAKAAQMDPESAHDDYVYKSIFDGHPYSFKQKGDFRDVVSLTRSKVQDFYTKHYHPSNGQAFCFGPQDFVDECLNLMDPYLSEYTADDRLRKNTEIGWVEMTKIKSIREQVPYPSYQDTNDFRVAVSYVLNDQPLDGRTKMAWHIIEDLLLGNPSASIPRVITDNDLGDDAIGGLQSHLRQWVLTIGVSGVTTQAKVDEARIRLQQKIFEVVANGFDQTALTATLNKLEMRFREQSSRGVPRGVTMFKDVLTSWTYGGDPRHVLGYSDAFAELKKEIEDNGQDILLSLITRHIVDNEHTLATESYPSTDLLYIYNGQEQEWLDSLDGLLTTDRLNSILREANDLRDIQQRPDSQEVLESISYLTVKDLRGLNFELNSKVHENILDSSVTMLEHEVANSNGIAYVDFAIDISNMDFDDVVLLPLFCELLLRSGTQTETGIELQREIDAETGGMTITPVIEEIVKIGGDGGYVVPNGENMVTKIVVRSSCIAETACLGMFNLFRDVLYGSDVQIQSKVIEILKKLIDDMEDDIQVNAHKYTTYRIQSKYGLPGFTREQWRGMTQLLSLRAALVQARDDWSALSMRLVLMADAMRRGNRNGMVLSLTGDKAAIKGVSTGVQIFLNDILPTPTQTTKFPDFGQTTHPWYTKGSRRMNDEITAEGSNEAFISPTRLNSVAKGGLLFDPGEPIRGYDLVVLQYIGGYFLFNELRFGQGAADARAVVDIDTGSVVYQSNRDPNIATTLDIYDQGTNFILTELGGKSSLPPEAEGAVIGAIGQLDGSALQPFEVGYVALLQYLKQDSKASRQKFREEILGATVTQMLSMTDRLGSWGKPSVAVITNQDQLNQAVTDGLSLKTCNINGLVC